MTITSWGFQGTIDEIQWAKHAQLLGNEYAAGPGLVPFAVAGSRQVRIPVGILHGKGITSEVTAAETVNLPTPSAGQWHLIVLRRVWATKSAAFVALPSNTTTMPLVGGPPVAFPEARLAIPGSTDDMPVMWVHTNSTDATLVTFPLLQAAVSARAAGRVSSAGMRDALYPNPAQGDEVFRTDKGWSERYYAARTAGNPGGAAVADWYPFAGRMPYASLTKSDNQLTGAAGSPTPVAFTADASPDGLWSASAPARIIPNLRGLWEISGKVRVSEAGTANGYIRVSKNGADASRSEFLAQTSSGAYAATRDLFVITSPGNDWLEVQALSTQPTQSIRGNQTLCTVRFLGPA